MYTTHTMANQEIRVDHFAEDSFIYSMQQLAMGARIGAAFLKPILKEVQPVVTYYANEKKAKVMQGIIFEARRVKKSLFPGPNITVLP